ncbi:16231_t:CDS:2, partial [Cetraspora pellucida]
YGGGFSFVMVLSVVKGLVVGLCGVRVITKVMLSNTEDPLPVQLIIKGVHKSSALMTLDLKSIRINLSLQTCNKAIAACRAHHNTGTEIAMKVLAPYNNTSETYLTYLHNTSKDICIEQQLKILIERDDQEKILYYQHGDILAPENSFEHYYQLTVSDELWLKQGCDCGHFCFGIDRKYDLNNEKAPVIVIVIEDQAGYGSSLVFSLCDKENHHIIQIAVQAVQANIPCSDPNCLHQYNYINLLDRKEFRRQLEYASNWYPLARIDKHRSTKLALQGLVRNTILCWFHIMATLGEYLRIWKVDWLLRYPIALVFKIIDNLIRDLKMNWICDEWQQSFIDGGRMLQVYDQANTVVKFIERLYEIRIFQEALVQKELGEINFDAGLATYWNMCMIEHRQMLPKKSVNKKCCINQGHLYVLLGLVLPIPKKMNYMLVEKQSRRFCSLYNFYPVNISTRISEKLNDMIIKLVNRDNLHIPETHYLVNVISGECTCYDYIWNGLFRDVCKHVHAARLYIEVLYGKIYIQEIKERLVKHFKNKERTVAPEKKNYIIHNSYKRIIIAKDPFHPIDNKPILITSGAPKNNGTKLRKNSQIFYSNNIQFNKTENTYINKVNQEHNSFDNSILFEVPIDFNEQEHNSFDEFLIDCNNQEYNSFDNSILSEVPIDYNESASRFVNPHSICRRNTTRTRNKRQNSSQTPNNKQRNDATFTIKKSLEELFLEKEYMWNPQAFTNAALAKRLRLDDNPAENGVKLYRWISNRKVRAKNGKENSN